MPSQILLAKNREEEGLEVCLCRSLPCLAANKMIIRKKINFQMDYYFHDPDKEKKTLS